MRSNPLYKSKSIMMSWLFSYFSILLIPLIISSIVYFRSSETIKQEINLTNSILLKQVQQVIDNKLTDIEQLCFQISWNPNLQSLLFARDALEPLHRYTVIQLHNEFRLHKMSNGYVDSFFIFLHNSHMILTPDSSYDMDLLQSNPNFFQKISYGLWSDLRRNYHMKEYMHIHTGPEVSGTAKDPDTIALVQSLPWGNQKEAAATLVILLDPSFLADAIENIQWLKQGSVFIIDRENRIMASTQPDTQMLPVNYPTLLNNEVRRDRINGKDVYISCISSQVNGWKYVYMTPASVFKEKVEYIQKLILISILLCLLLGGLVSYLFTRKNYNPLSAILRNIAMRNGTALTKGVNEYQYIQESLDNTYNENNRIHEQLRQQNEVVQSYFLMKLLRGNIDGNTSVSNTLSVLNLPFDSGCFAVLLFNIENYSLPFLYTGYGDNREKLGLIQFIINNFSTAELAEQAHPVYLTEVDGILACLIHIHADKTEDGEAALFSLANDLKQLFQKKYFVHCTVSVSRIHPSAADIHKAYKEARQAMEYRITTGRKRIIRYADIKDTENRYNYTLEDEQKLINFIKAGDLSNAESTLNHIFDGNFPNENLSIKMVKCFMFDLVSTIIKALNTINPGFNHFCPEGPDPVNQLLDSDTVEEMKDHMKDILKHVCNHIHDNRRDRSEAVDRILLHVQHRYSDINLNISTIADELQLTPYYISKLFKEKTGENLLDYINKVRLAKAKLLLSSQQLSINDVAGASGYYNSNAFIRIFKKYEGITPGQYKKISGYGQESCGSE